MLHLQDTKKKNILTRLRNYFVAGVLLCAPLFITILIAWWLINFFDSSVLPFIPPEYNPETYLNKWGWPFGVPGLGIVILIIALTFIGAIFTGFLGRYFVRWYEQLLKKMPIISSIYSASKQVIETIFSNQSDAFSRAVLVEYPRRDIWTIGFVTGKVEGEIKKIKTDGEVFLSIYVPTTPNPTSGFLLFVPEKDTIPLDMSVEDAIKQVISLGIVSDDAS